MGNLPSFSSGPAHLTNEMAHFVGWPDQPLFFFFTLSFSTVNK
jgi:hypothetical protein